MMQIATISMCLRGTLSGTRLCQQNGLRHVKSTRPKWATISNNLSEKNCQNTQLYKLITLQLINFVSKFKSRDYGRKLLLFVWQLPNIDTAF